MESMDRQKAILDAARKLFSDYGYKRVSMDEIAAIAGVAKGTLYLYFKDKDDLFGCFVEEAIDDIKSITDDITAQCLPFFDEIHKTVYTMLMYRKNLKFLVTITKEAKELKTNSVCEKIKRLDNKALEYIQNLLNRGIINGDIRQCNVEILSFLIFKVYIALAFDWEEGHETLGEKEISDNILLLLKTGL